MDPGKCLGMCRQAFGQLKRQGQSTDPRWVLAARGAPVCRCIQYWAEVEVGASVYCVCLLCVYVCACACVYSVVCMCVYVCCV